MRVRSSLLNHELNMWSFGSLGPHICSSGLSTFKKRSTCNQQPAYQLVNLMLNLHLQLADMYNALTDFIQGRELALWWMHMNATVGARVLLWVICNIMRRIHWLFHVVQSSSGFAYAVDQEWTDNSRSKSPYENTEIFSLWSHACKYSGAICLY